MLHFLKKNYKLSELIQDNYVDIHSHVLPGLDDGARTTLESINLVKEMRNLGFNQIIATPHIMSGVWENTEIEIRGSLNYLNGKISCSDKICYAAEYMLDNFLIKKMNNQSLLCLKDKYLLVELSYLQPPINIFELLFELQLNGYKPVLAHPERYKYYFNNYEQLLKLKNTGCLFQLNLMSVVGHYGEKAKSLASRLLSDNLIDFVGSDIHHKGHLEVFSKKFKLKEITELENAIKSNSIFSI